MKKNKISTFSKFILWLNMLAIILLLLSYLATIINPSKFWPVSYFGLAYPFILLSNIIFVFIWLLKRKIYFLLSLIMIVVGYKPLKRTIGYHYFSSNKTIDDKAKIKLMTYNCGSFHNREFDNRDTTTKNILKVIAEQKPDILAMQEFLTRKKGKYATLDSILSILNTKYYQFTPAIGNDFESGGVAIFSKYPIVNKGNIIFDTLLNGNRCEWADIQYNNEIIRVYAVHLASIRFQPEDYEFIDEPKKNLGMDLSSTKRIIKRLKIAFVKRGLQVNEMKAHMANCKTPYVVMGDFNDTPCSYSLAEMSENMKNGFVENGKGLGVTYNGDFPNFQIDYILASKQFKFNTYEIIKKEFSDHYPVRCDVELKN